MDKKEQKAYFAIIPANVRYDKRLKANEKLLYGEITALTNERGYCWASNKYFSDLYGVTTQAVSKWINDLKDCGYISTEYTYKSGTKEIENRIIKLVSTGVSEASTNVSEVSINDLGGYQQKIKDNNTRDNNTNNNTKNIYSQVVDLFNETCVSFPKVTALSDKRKKAIHARLNTYTIDDFKKAFEMAEQSDFLKGNNNRDWQANFDWIIKDANIAKILDGNYQNRNSRAEPQKQQEQPKQEEPTNFYDENGNFDVDKYNAYYGYHK